MPKRFFRALRYGLRGLKVVWREETFFPLQVLCGVCAIVLSWFFQLSPIEFVVVILAIVCVLTAEAFNTAIEELCDMIQPERDSRVAKIKDLAAGGVLIAALGALCIGLLIFLPHIW